jgi:DNA-binding NtrC family response regulator
VPQDSASGYRLKVLGADGSPLRSLHLAVGEHVVGSSSEAEVALDLPGISRRHACLRVLADGGVVVTDLGSKNGTFVGGRRIQETAVAGFTVLAFGGIQAVLQPEDPARAQLLLEPPEADGSRTRPARSVRDSTTDGLHPVERLAESLEDLLLPFLDGAGGPEETAAALAERWIEELPLGRVEILRAAPNGYAVIAAASTAGRLPKATATLEVEGTGGWKVALRAPSSAPLQPLVPLFRLALGMLDLGGGLRPRRTQAAVRAGAAMGEEPMPAGLSPETARIYRQAGKVARGDVPVLILGESGAGKEVLARWVHARSRRAAGPFLAINCAALPRELLEAELFGIEKGVATGVEARPGLLERAGGGTVFLDEVGDMAAETQAKVLRVLESTSLYRVGGRAPVAVDVRFVAATNRDLEALVEEGSFRRDLYHRLAAFQVRLPPLRERRSEIPALAARFFHREIAKNGVASPGITRAALGALVRYPWPGNVRELQNEIAKAALLLEPGEALDLQHLSERVRRPPGSGGEAPAAFLTLEETVLRAEREAFIVALAAASGDAARAMEILGVSRTTWYRKLKELGLAAPSSPD